MIPQTLFRSVPAETTDEVEAWWDQATRIHPGWQHRTFREPVDPADFPLSSHLWPSCDSGAQKAGLIRLELVLTHGGVWLDSDVEVFRSFESLRHCELFCGYEDDRTIPDAVFGAEAGHPVIADMLAIAMVKVELGEGAWETGPGVFTDVLPYCHQAILMPPAAFYPYSWREKHLRRLDHSANPFTICCHHWHHSWK